MKFEGVGRVEKKDNLRDIEHQRDRVKGEIKSGLIFFGCNLDDDKCIQEWLDNLSPSFDRVFDEACAQSEDILNNWDKGGEMERKDVLDFFKKELKV